MKVLVTGGAGFIGSHVVDRLVDDGCDVVVIDSLDPGVYTCAPDYLNPKAQYRFVDLRSWRPDGELDGLEAAVHLAALGGVSRAARESDNVIDANVTGTARLVSALRHAAQLKSVVLTSSFSVYGEAYRYRCTACGVDRDGSRSVADLQAGRFEVMCDVCEAETQILPLGESARPSPLETYGASKYMQELCFRGFDSSPVHVLRQSSVYGRRLRLDDGEATIIARIAGWIRAGISPTLLEDGQQIRDWVHVDDVVDAATALAQGAEAPSVINVCTGVPTRLIEACEGIAEAMHTEVRPTVVGGFRAGDMRHCLGNSDRLVAVLGRPATAFADGIARVFGDSAQEA